MSNTFLELLFKYVEEHEKGAFQLQYDYGICEVPFLILYNGGGKCWEGTLEEFKKWVQ